MKRMGDPKKHGGNNDQSSTYSLSNMPYKNSFEADNNNTGSYCPPKLINTGGPGTMDQTDEIVMNYNNQNS